MRVNYQVRQSQKEYENVKTVNIGQFNLCYKGLTDWLKVGSNGERVNFFY